MIGRVLRTIAVAAALLFDDAPSLLAQDASSPGFSLATSHIYTTRERPAVSLTYRQVTRLDFRVYRVNDPFAFFARLRDPHQIGSEEPIVPEEQTWLEAIAYWKAARRGELRNFVRRQFSPAYRQVRRDQRDTDAVVLRQTLNVNSFAQVPLLNPSQLVNSWREILPPVREAEYRRIPLDLTAAGIYVVEAVNPPLRAYTVVIVSDVGLVTKTAPGGLLVFAANRFSGAPLADCRLQVLADQTPLASGQTAADGTFETSLTTTAPDSLVTIADCGGQSAVTDPSAYSLREPSRDLVGYVYTDRPVYRPGHTVRFKAVLRWREKGALLPFGRQPVEVSVADDSDKVLLRERKTPDEFGALDGTLTVPANGALGYYRIRIQSGELSATGSFEVQEYRKPEFDVAVTAADKFALQGGSLKATVAARYYFGQPVSGGSVQYVVHQQGYVSPLRFESSGEDGDGFDGYAGGDEIEQGTARLTAAGTAELTIPLKLDENGRDYTARIEARVIDASGREVSGATSVVATYGNFLLIGRPDRFVYAPGQPANIDVRASDYLGTPRADLPVRGVMERVEYGANYRQPKVTTVAQIDLTTDADGRARWPLAAPAQPGSYRARLTSPFEGRQVSDTVSLWVPGPAAADMAARDRFLELIADRRTYTPGDTAQLVIRGEEFETSVLVTKESQHLSYHQVVRARGNEAITVPISDDDIGDTYVSILFMKDDRLFRAERRLTVPATTRQLTISAETDKPIARPGEAATFTIRVADANGAPVRAQLSLGIVDEAIYGVRPDATPDPLRFFYRREYNMVATSFSREFPFVGYSGTEQLLLARRRRPLTLADFKADRPDRPRVRKDFPDTVYWAADVITGADGSAQLKIQYPDSLTSWRLTARAVTASTAVGAARTNTITTKDLILRVVTPRFLTEGDEVTIPAIVHNYLPDAQTVAVSMKADGLTAAGGSPTAARSVQVAQNGQRRTDWTYSVNDVRPVTVTGQVTGNTAGDAMQVTIPVSPAGLQRNTGTSGALVRGGQRELTLALPPGANAAGRSVRIALTPSLAGTMLGALDYLTSFPWGCTEQTLSSIVPNLAVMRALSEMKLAPTERMSVLDRQVSDGLKRLYDYQHDDGGWGWWKTDRNHPFMTAYAVDGLMQAREHGVRVEEWRISQGAAALTQMYQKYPRMVPDLKAYVVYVLARAQVQPSAAFTIAAAIDDVWSARERMTASGQAMLLMTLDHQNDSRRTELAGTLLAAAQTRGDVSWWQVDSDPLLEDLGDTSVEASALALQALVAKDPDNPLLERVSRWLVANRTAGAYWVNTKQTALTLHGLLAYMKARGERAAPVSAEVFVNQSRVATASFDDRALTSPNPVWIEAPAVEGPNNVTIVTKGEGSVYFDASVRYYDKPAAEERTGSRRLALVRRYFTLTPVERNGRTVYREQPFDGTARAGDVILVRLSAAGANDWKYLILEDPLPAGTEQVEREDAYELERRPRWFWGSQREFRDDRTVLFLNDFSEGRYEFVYLLKVTTPGRFNAMPARIAPMYVAGVSASSDTASVTVTADTLP